jgi:tetratricopeptide (TPR) repeat protein
VDQQTKAALKRDQFIDTTTHGLEWATENKHSVIVTSAILLAVILVLVGAGVFYNHRSDQASNAFGAAMADYQTPLAQPDEQVPPGTKTYASAAERAKSANASFLAVANQYGLTPSGRMARYFAGLTYIEEGQNASAESTLKEVAGGWNHNLAALANLSLAQLYHQTGRDAQAIDIYNQLTAKPASTVPAGLAQLQLAELYETQSKPDLAKKIYAQLKDKEPKSPAGMIAAQKLNPGAAQAPGQ